MMHILFDKSLREQLLILLKIMHIFSAHYDN